MAEQLSGLAHGSETEAVEENNTLGPTTFWQSHSNELWKCFAVCQIWAPQKLAL